MPKLNADDDINNPLKNDSYDEGLEYIFMYQFLFLINFSN